MGPPPWETKDRLEEERADIDTGNAPHEEEAHVQRDAGKTPHEEEAEVEPENEAGPENTGVDGAIKSEAGEVGEADVVKQALFPSSACSA